MESDMKPLCICLLFLTTLPLLVYPFVLIANVMSLAATATATPAPIGLKIVSLGFLWTTTLYPVPYLICLIAALMNLKKEKIRTALHWQLALVGYLLMIGIFFTAWLNLG